MSMKILTMFLLVCGAMALTAAAVSVSETPQCPTNWTPYNGHCYYCNSTQTTWDDAENCCRSQNGHLALVASVEEYDFIQQLVATKLSQPVWLRGSTSTQVGKLALLELSVTFHLTSLAQLVCPAAECCLVMSFGDEKFSALPCATKMPFVCEKDELQP